MTKGLWKKLRPALIWRGVEVLVIALLVAGTLLGRGQVLAVRQRLAERQAALARTPDEVQAAFAIRNELQKRQHDIDRIEEYLIEPDDVGDVIGTLEGAATTHNVQLQVPTVKERVLVDEGGREITSGTLLRDVELELSVVGSPTNLLGFLHEAEHLPYLMLVESWRLDADPKRVPGFVNEAPSAPGGPLDASTLATLSATAVVSVKNPTP